MALPIAIQELYRILELDRTYSIYSAELSFRQRLEELRKELDETIAEIGEDDEKLRDEVGDLFLDLLAACVIAEEEGLFRTEDAVMDAVEKLRRRKPQILERRRAADLDEEARIYRAAKSAE